MSGASDRDWEVAVFKERYCRKNGRRNFYTLNCLIRGVSDSFIL